MLLEFSRSLRQWALRFYSLVLLQFQVVAVDASRTIARTVMGISSLIFDHVYVVYRGVRLPNVPVLVFRNCILDFRPDRVPKKEGRCMIDNLLYADLRDASIPTGQKRRD